MIGFDELGFAAGSVRGYRAWTGKDACHRLIGRYGGFWYPGENLAYCRRHQAPEERCKCGYWAYWDNPHGNEITGIVEGYGPTIIGEKGFRCGKARILALATRNPQARQELAEVYKVPVYRTTRQLARHWKPEGAPPLPLRRWVHGMVACLLALLYPLWILIPSQPWYGTALTALLTGWIYVQAIPAVRLLRRRQVPDAITRLCRKIRRMR